jgi:DNA polymerase III alpha subunit
MYVPLFKSHYSLNKSILTLEKEHQEFGPKSILQLCKENELESPFLIEDNMSSFLQMYYNSQELKVNIKFGLRLCVCDNFQEKNESSLKCESKIIVFLKDSGGYENLNKIFSFAAKEGFYYAPRIDFSKLEEFWSDSLILGVPFYDSYLFNNFFKMSSCVPKKLWTTPVFFWEENGLPFDKIFKTILESYVSKNHENSEIIKAKSIYYNKKDDFLAYLTMRCIGKKSTLQMPKLDHLCSDNFCLESFLSTK